MAKQQFIEYFYGPFFKGPMTFDVTSKNNRFGGIESVGSGAATVTISTFSVRSDSMIFTQVVTAVASNDGQVIQVASISPDNFFTLGLKPAPVGTDFKVMWAIIRTAGTDA